MGAPWNLYDGHEEMRQAGVTRVIGIEIKVRQDGGPTVELGMWVPPRELLIANMRATPYTRLEFPCTIHTLHGDLNYQVPEVR